MCVCVYVCVCVCMHACMLYDAMMYACMHVCMYARMSHMYVCHTYPLSLPPQYLHAHKDDTRNFWLLQAALCHLLKALNTHKCLHIHKDDEITGPASQDS